jgi:hypothetical protein
MSLTSASELKSAIAKLQTERASHAKAIAEIDSVFEQLGKLSPPAKRGPKTAKPAAKKRSTEAPKKRKTFSVSGPNSILQTVKAAGKEGVATGDIVKRWEKQGRSGNVYGIIGQLVDEGKLRRKKVTGRRGSVHTLS